MHITSFLSILISSLIIIAAFSIPVISAYTKSHIPAHLKKPKLDIILTILYIPLSVFGSLWGMVSEGYMYDPTRLQILLCDVITLLGFLTPLVCLAAITSSVLLRIRSRSVASFCIQFSGVLYMAFPLLLILILGLT